MLVAHPGAVAGAATDKTELLAHGKLRPARPAFSREAPGPVGAAYNECHTAVARRRPGCSFMAGRNAAATGENAQASVAAGLLAYPKREEWTKPAYRWARDRSGRWSVDALDADRRGRELTRARRRRRHCGSARENLG